MDNIFLLLTSLTSLIIAVVALTMVVRHTLSPKEEESIHRENVPLLSFSSFSPEVVGVEMEGEVLRESELTPNDEGREESSEEREWLEEERVRLSHSPRRGIYGTN